MAITSLPLAFTLAPSLLVLCSSIFRRYHVLLRSMHKTGQDHSCSLTSLRASLIVRPTSRGSS